MSRIRDVFPCLRVNGAKAAIAFYSNVFGAVERFRLTEPSGSIGHAELKLENSLLRLSDEFPEFDCFAPESPGSTGMVIHVHCDNCDEIADRAVAAGAIMIRPPADQFYGARSCNIRDPFGHEWMIGHEIEKVEPEEMQRGYTEMLDRS